jgi:flavin-binding protein dodecin
MARIYTKKTSRVAHVCGRGGHEIPKGDGYYTAAPGFRGREIYRCFQHPFRPSELTTSLTSQPLAAQEALEEALATLEQGDWDGLRSSLEEFASEVRDYADQREQALDAWENGNSMLEELNDTAQNAADEAEQLADNVQEFEEEEPDRDAEWDSDEAYEEALEAWQQEAEEAWEAAVNEALDNAQSLEF